MYNTEDQMEEFVTEMQNNIGTTSECGKKSSKIRDLFSMIIKSTPEIKINECNNEGDITFEVLMRSMGVTYDVLVNYKTEISSDFAADFIGELLVRDNIGKFVNLMRNLKNNYSDKVNSANHRKFGMTIYKEKFVLTFHISLVQNILTEDLKWKIV